MNSAITSRINPDVPTYEPSHGMQAKPPSHRASWILVVHDIGDE
jgi:hypothetical protein